MKTRSWLGSALLLLTAGTTWASNTGFSLQVFLSGGHGGCDQNLIATPYYFFPNGQVGTPQVAHDLVNVFPSASGFARVNPTTALVESWIRTGSSWSGTDFPLEEGLGLAITVDADVQDVIVGSHDNAFPGVLLRSVAPGATEHLISVPYHTTWDTADELLDALFDGSNRLSVATFRGGTLIERTVDVGPVRSGIDFSLVPQEALLLRITADTLFASPYYFRAGMMEIAPMRSDEAAGGRERSTAVGPGPAQAAAGLALRCPFLVTGSGLGAASPLSSPVVDAPNHP